MRKDSHAPDEHVHSVTLAQTISTGTEGGCQSSECAERHINVTRAVNGPQDACEKFRDCVDACYVGRRQQTLDLSEADDTREQEGTGAQQTNVGWRSKMAHDLRL